MVRLRPDLKVVRVSPTDFHLLDPSTHDSFKMGADERYLLFLMERLSSPDEVLRAFANRFGRVLEKRPLLEFAEQLSQSGLLTAAGDAGNGGSREPIHA
jgi:hypothetical protein